MIPIPAKRGLKFNENEGIEITVATNAGACFGVVRAIKLAHQAANRSAKEGSSVFSFGPLIHNENVVKDLSDRGVKTVSRTEEVEGGTVVLRSHGVRREMESELKGRGIRVVDATCPLVKKPQRIASHLGDKGYFLILVGDLKHPEVQGVLSYFGKQDFLVTYDPKALDQIPQNVQKVGIVAQTTIEVSVFNEIVNRAKERFSEVSIYNTICDATSIRQTEVQTLAQQADVMIIVGGKNSSNTNKLVKICKGFQKDTYHIEELSEIEPSWFGGKRKIGVTGGASTPHEFVDRVGSHIATLLEAGS